MSDKKAKEAWNALRITLRKVLLRIFTNLHDPRRLREHEWREKCLSSSVCLLPSKKLEINGCFLYMKKMPVETYSGTGLSTECWESEETHVHIRTCEAFWSQKMSVRGGLKSMITLQTLRNLTEFFDYFVKRWLGNERFQVEYGVVIKIDIPQQMLFNQCKTTSIGDKTLE